MNSSAVCRYTVKLYVLLHFLYNVKLVVTSRHILLDAVLKLA